MQDAAFTYHLKKACGASKDADGHVVMHTHDPSFQRSWMPFCVQEDIYDLEGSVYLIFNI